MSIVDEHGNRADDCGHCTLLPTVNGWVHATQTGCPVHSEHPDARRLRTQAERDADDHTWRHTAGTRPGYATYPGTAPGNPSWWQRPVLRLEDPAETERWERDKRCTKWCGFCHLGNAQPAVVEVTHHHTAEEFAAQLLDIAARTPVTEDFGPVPQPPRPPRRRWWHRLAGRWWHVFTPGFLGELVNDIWSHAPRRYTRRTR